MSQSSAPAAGRAGKSGRELWLRLGRRLRLAGGGRDFCLQLVVFRETLELIDEHQRVLGRDFELLAAGLAADLVVQAQQVVAKLGKLGAILIVGARGKSISFDAADPADAVLIRPPASGTLISSRTRFRLFGEECAFVESHTQIVTMNPECLEIEPRSDRERALWPS